MRETWFGEFFPDFYGERWSRLCPRPSPVKSFPFFNAIPAQA
jgi:hypothetical protein